MNALIALLLIAITGASGCVETPSPLLTEESGAISESFPLNNMPSDELGNPGVPEKEAESNVNDGYRTLERTEEVFNAIEEALDYLE